MNPYRHFIKTFLVTLLISDSFSGFTSEINGFEGMTFTFTCPGGNEPFFWYKGNGTSGDRIGLSFSGLGGVRQCSLPGCTISPDTGDMTISSISLDDEGWYTCKKSVSSAEFNADSLHFVKVNVNVQPFEDNVDMTEVKFPVERQPFDIDCTVERIKPRPQIYFKFSDSAEIYTGEEMMEDLGSGTLKISSKIQRTFMRSDDGRKFRCVVQPYPGKGNKVIKDRRIYVDWEYSTRVQELDPHEIPLAGSQKTLECVVEDVGKPQAESARWLLNGLPIRGSAKYSGFSSLQLTTKDLLKTDVGEYRCSINNRVSSGISVGGYHLQVWYLYSSEVFKPNKDELPLIGADIVLGCNGTEKGYPLEVLSVNWYRGGEMILEGGKYERITIYTLSIKNIEKYADNGEYSCTIVNPAGEGHSTGRYQLEVVWGPSGHPTVEPAEVTTAIGVDLNLTCGGAFDDGNPVVFFTIWTKQGDEKYHRNISGTILILENLQTVRASGHYQCQAGNAYGKTAMSTASEVIVEAPVVIEHPVSLMKKASRWNDENFRLSCTISGSNIAQYTWEKDGHPLDKQFFEYLPLEIIHGIGSSNFMYGQTKAMKSTIKRNIDGYQFSCDNIEFFNGNYTCHPQGSMAGHATRAVSQAIIVTTHYKAFWAGQDKVIRASIGNTNISIFCNVCSNPKVNSFKWTFEGSPLRNGIQDLGASVVIDKVISNDYGMFTCRTITLINSLQYSSEFDITLEEKGHPDPPKDFRVLSTTSQSVNLTWIPGHAAGYGPLRFKLELKTAIDNAYTEIRSDIIGTVFFLDKLLPFTEYTVMIQAFNQRPELDGRNYSDLVLLTFETRVAPNISLQSVEVHDKNMTVVWQYVMPRHTKQSTEDDEYSVGVSVEYKQFGNDDYKVFPTPGNNISLLDAHVGQVFIHGEFDIYSVYLVRLVSYENGITCCVNEASKPPWLKSEPLSSKHEEDTVLPLALGIILPVVLLIAIGITICILRQNKYCCIKKSHNTNLSTNRNQFETQNQSSCDTSGMVLPVQNNPVTDVDEDVYSDVLEIRPAISSVLNEIRDYIRIQVETTLLNNPDDLELDSTPIGAGHYGEVYKGILKTHGKKMHVAVKKAKHLGTPQEKDDFFKEAAIMRKVHHKNVLPLLCIVIKDNIPHVVTPFAENGDLKKYISRKDKAFTILNKLKFGLDISRGMECLERNHIVHRDLACRNCLVNSDHRIQVTDFGLARDIYQSDIYKTKQRRDVPICWMAIESINPRNSVYVYTTKSDVWSFAITLWEILTRGGRPYVGILNLYQFLKNGHRLQIPPDTPKEIVDLMQCCWNENPSHRPSFADIVQYLDSLIQGMREKEFCTDSSVYR